MNKKKKRLLIDPKGGIAGDMFAASLISAGADFNLIQIAMSKAASKLGSAEISMSYTEDNSTRLLIKLHSNKHHLNSTIAKEILVDLFKELSISENYCILGIKILDVLLAAEKKAHSENIYFTNNRPLFLHDNHSENTNLHEAQDIIIDIIGAVIGMQELNIEPEVKLLSPVSVGNGFINFSHGRLPVPAPATRIILEQYNIKWKQGPVNTELCTPTGASIIAALKANYSQNCLLDEIKIISEGKSRGTKDLDIPPLKVYVYTRNL